MEIRKIFFNKIDIVNNNTGLIDIQLPPKNLNSYIDELSKEILESPNKRAYNFKEGNTEVKTSLTKILEDTPNLEKIVGLNAERLLEKERNSQELISSRNLEVKIQKGSLLHLHFVANDLNHIIKSRTR